MPIDGRVRSVEAASLTLSREELIEITGYKRTQKQKAHFDRLGVPNIIRPDNTLSVARVHYEQLPFVIEARLAKGSVRTIRKPPSIGPKSK